MSAKQNQICLGAVALAVGVLLVAGTGGASATLSNATNCIAGKTCVAQSAAPNIRMVKSYTFPGTKGSPRRRQSTIGPAGPGRLCRANVKHMQMLAPNECGYQRVGASKGLFQCSTRTTAAGCVRRCKFIQCVGVGVLTPKN